MRQIWDNGGEVINIYKKLQNTFFMSQAGGKNSEMQTKSHRNVSFRLKGRDEARPISIMEEKWCIKEKVISPIHFPCRLPLPLLNYLTLIQAV